MKKYSLAINILVFVISLVIGISVINIVIKNDDLGTIDPALRMVNIGEIIGIRQHSLLFEYSHEDKIWIVEIEITDDTEFHTSKVLSENGIIYGREIKEAEYNKLTDGTRVVIDWNFIEKRGFVANDIIIVDPELSNLLF